MKCSECNSTIEISPDVEENEVITCPICGAEFKILLKEGSKVLIEPLSIEGEDWGE